MPPIDLSLRDARRVVLAAQGFAQPRPVQPTAGDVHAVITRLGMIQLDFVTVLHPAHYQVPFSRLGPYARDLLDEAVYRDAHRGFTEQWAHEASIVPLDVWPLLRHRMASRRLRPWGIERRLARHAEYVAWVLREVRARGPLTADTLAIPDRARRRIPGTWVGTLARAVLEVHFTRGRLAVASRRSDFARLYDVPERVLPAAVLARRFRPADADRELLRRAARALGVATAADIADYWRMPVSQARPRLDELVAAGELLPARVEGWREPALLVRDAPPPRPVGAAALLCPFDPLIWFRTRTARLFGFDYRFEIFVPAARRRWGAYVLPFLLDERLTARVDLKTDRPARRLLVQAAYREPGQAAAPVAIALAAELRRLARWLGLEAIAVGRRGDLARALAAAVRDP